MTAFQPLTAEPLAPEKFKDPARTAKGEARAVVALTHLKTLWFNTGSLCNITCKNCYMESSPTNDALVYLTAQEVRDYLDEIGHNDFGVEEIAFTGGEPFMNKDLPDMLGDALGRGFTALVLTNAMKPLRHKRDALIKLRQTYGDALRLRVSVDHHTQAGHEAVRGEGTWAPMIDGLKWLSDNGFPLAVAGRMCWNETEAEARNGYRDMFAAAGIALDVDDSWQLVLFPEMDATRDVPEITVNCWNILGVDPASLMCASSRMVVKRKGDARPTVMPCTLLPYDTDFDMGPTLAEAGGPVALNHPHCARFCVLGGASCSAT